jgi:RHS repeat-associated protein
MINYTIPFPVPTYPPNMNGVALAAANGGLFTATGIQQWSRNAYGVDWSPLSANIIIGRFNTSSCFACSDVLLQGTNSSKSSYLVLGNSSGAIFSAGTALASNVTWTANAYTLVAGNFSGSSSSTGVYFQSTTPGGTNYVADNVSGGTVTVTGTSATQETAQAPTSAGRTAAQFSVTPTGGASYNIPLWNPPGARDIEPHLALHYLSGGPDGLMGPGWSVTGLSAVTRCNHTWAQDGAAGPVTLSGSDALCLDGARLVPVTGYTAYCPGGTPYGSPATYETALADFSLVSACGIAGNGPAYFEVQGKDGRYYEYGNGRNSEIYASKAATPFAWGLDKVSDRQGNNMVLTYVSGATVLMPSTIQYTQTPSTGSSYPYEVAFSYSSRPDGTSTTKEIAGYTVSDADVLTLVNVLSAGTSVRQYQLTYSSSPTTERPLLSFVQECGGSAGTDCLRPTNITYQPGADGWSGTPSSTGIAAQGGYIPVDLNGDGIPDALYGKVSGSSVVWYARIATSSGFGPEIATGATTTGGVQPIVGAFTGTSKQEFLVPSGNYLSIFTYNGSGFTQGPTNATACCYDFAADWDGDGLPDLVSNASNAVSVLRNTTQPGGAVAFASSSTIVYYYPTDTYSAAVLYPTRATTADFNGDGRADLVVQYATYDQYGYVYTYYADVLLSNGFSQFASDASLYQGGAGGPSFPQFEFGDWNGDGCTDIIATSAIYVSDCAGGFNQIAAPVPNTSNGTPAAILTVDWDGDGQTDRLYADPTTNMWMVQRSTGGQPETAVSTGIPAPSTRSFFVVDQNSDGQADLGYVDTANGYYVSDYPHQGYDSPPDLANAFSDGFDISFSPSYVPISQKSYTPGTSAAFPDEDFRGPMYVVDEYSASDGTGGTYEETLAYGGARLNLQGRGFEGFATTQVQDSRNSVITTTDYRQDYPYIGLVTEEDVDQNGSLAPGSAPISPSASSLMEKTVNKYALVLVQGNACATGVCFPYVQKQDKYNYEVDAPLTGNQISTSSTTYGYDNFGNITSTTSVLTDTDEGGGGAPASPYYGEQWTTVIQNKINNDTATWCLGRPYDTTTTKSTPSGQETRTVDHTMDYQNCRASQEIIQPGDSKLQVTTTFGFDGCGNTNSVSVVGLDQNGAAMPARTTGYDYGTMCTFPEETTDALGNTTTTTYNYAFGLKSAVQETNGVKTSWQYDDFGRPQVETFGDGTEAKWSYSDCVSSDCWNTADLRFQTTETFLDASGNEIRSDDKYSDGLDRLRLESTSRALGVWTTSEVDYDSLGRKTRAYVPYSSGSNGYNGFTYDIANRVLSDTLYDSSGSAYRTTSVAYLGLTTQVTDALGNVTQRVSDVSGKLRQVIDPPADGNPTSGITKYVYDPFGNLTLVDDADGVTSTYSYNVQGFKTASTDANSGSWTFVPNSLNELVSQTDAKGQTTTFKYDALGRVQYRYEPESSTPVTWTYGSSASAHNVGQLVSVTDPNGYSESYTYDNLARKQTVVYTEDGTGYQYDYGYNSLGKIATITYPTSTSGYRFELKYAYDNWGYLNEVEDANAGTVFWQLDGENDSGSPTTELLGNGVQVNSSYMPWTNELLTRSEGSGGSTNNLANLSYTWDVDGNLHERQDLKQNLAEIFGIDALNRITSTTLNGTQTLSTNYDAAGDILSKSDVGSYTYGDSKHPHAVTTAGSWALTYDADGNMTSRDGGSITWYSYNQPNTIAFGGNTTQFFYDSNHQRYKQVANYGGTVETTHYVGGMLQVITRNGVTEYRHQIPAGSATVIYTRRSDGTAGTYYSTSDHQSSTDLLTDSGGNVLATASFTPFGARRGGNWQGVPSTSDYSTFASTTRQGYTGQEMLDSVSLVDMNGRVYDPYLGRFLSPDNVIQSLAVSQSVNPYSYAWDNPLKYLDPSGHSLIGDIAGLVAGIIMAIIFPPSAGIWFAMLDGFVGGFVGAAVSTGNMSAALEAGLIGAGTAGLFYEAGTLVQGYVGQAWQTEAAVAAHAAVGCASAVMSSGNCGKGALAAGLGEVADRSGLVGSLSQWGTDREQLIEATAVSGAVGGAVASVTGGNFSDGFSIGAAGYLFNDFAHVELPRLAGIERQGDTLVGNVPVSCDGSSSECGEAMGQLRDASKANALDISFHPATTWDRIASFFLHDMLSVEFESLQCESNECMAGEELSGQRGGTITLVESGPWQTNSVVVDHEFMHALGLGHNDIPGSLMYPISYSTTKDVLEPQERQTLLSAYGP